MKKGNCEHKKHYLRKAFAAQTVYIYYVAYPSPGILESKTPSCSKIFYLQVGEYSNIAAQFS